MEYPVSLNFVHVYEIILYGEIGPAWLAGFAGDLAQAEIISAAGQPVTRLRIVTDQSGLVGLIRRLHGLGVVLVSVQPWGCASGRAPPRLQIRDCSLHR